jgi:spore coat polysaccharide biosynthesis predicted glycosyltransferase SpsG
MDCRSAKTLTPEETALHTVQPGVRRCPPQVRPMLWIHTGASPSKGFGHLRRSLVLARLLTANSTIQVIFVLAAHDQWSGTQIESNGFELHRIAPGLPWPVGETPLGLVIDIRGEEVSRALALEAKRRGVPLLSIHDLGLELLPSNVIVDGSVAPGEFGAAQQGALYSGISYLVLDPVFAALNRLVKQLRPSIRNVVIAPGGGDARQYFPGILKGLRLWGRDLEVTGLRGFSSWGQEQIAFEDWSPVRFRWAERDAAVPELMFDADLIIAAGGLSVYEAMCVGTPVMAFAWDDYQHVTVARLNGLGGCIDLGKGMLLEPSMVRDQVSELDGDFEARKRLSERGRQLVDGVGAWRVTQLVRGLIAEALQTQGMK